MRPTSSARPPLRRAAQFGLVSLAVLSLAACNRGGDPEADASLPASDAAMTADMAYEPMDAADATAPVGDPVDASAVAAAPGLSDARAFDQAASTAGGDVDAYTYQDQGQQVRVWTDPRLGARIVEPGPEGRYVYYYRSGADLPYLLRLGDVFFVLDGGRIARAYDLRGRTFIVTADRRSAIERRLDQRARRLRREAIARREARQERRQEARQEAARENRQDQRDMRAVRENAARAENRAENRAELAERRADRAEIAQDRAERAQDRAQRLDTKAAERRAERAADQAEVAKDRAAEAALQAKRAERQADRAETLAERCARLRRQGKDLPKACDQA